MSVTTNYELINYISEDSYFEEQLVHVKQFILALSMCEKEELEEWFIFEDNGMIVDLRNSFLTHKNEHNQKCLEGYEYYIFKKDNTKRKITIPNAVAYFMFCYNTFMYEYEISKIYDDIDDSIANIYSKIYGKYHFLFYTYEDIDVDRTDKFQCSSPFSMNQRKTLLLNAKYRHVLYVDLENHYNNIYTHVIERIGKDGINTTKIPAEYFEFLDKYSMLINGNETSGIITGPFSSKLISELLLTHIDHKIIEIIREKDFVIEYTRFVDDYHFYCDNQYHLESLLEEIEKLFFEYRQKINNTKVKIHDTFISSNESFIAIKDSINSILILADDEKYDNSNEEILEEFYIKNEIFVNLSKLLSIIESQTSFSTQKQYIVAFTQIIVDNNNHFICEMMEDDEVKTIIVEFFISLLGQKKFLSKEIITLIKEIDSTSQKLNMLKELNKGSCIDLYLDINYGVNLFYATRPKNIGKVCQGLESMNEISYIITKPEKKIDSKMVNNIRNITSQNDFKFSREFIDSLYDF